MIISKTRKLIVIFISGICLQSCVTDEIPEGEIVDHYLDGCSKKVNGVLVPIRCPRKESPIMSTDQRIDSIERFRDFMVSSKYQLALDMSRKREREGVVTNHTELYDYGDEMKMMIGDKFIVSLYFRNYSLFPNKYYDHTEFRKDQSETFRLKWTDEIFSRYLGRNYQRYEPKLGVVSDDEVGITVLVHGLTQLKEVTYRDPLISIRHIADPIYPLEEIAN